MLLKYSVRMNRIYAWVSFNNDLGAGFNGFWSLATNRTHTQHHDACTSHHTSDHRSLDGGMEWNQAWWRRNGCITMIYYLDVWLRAFGQWLSNLYARKCELGSTTVNRNDAKILCSNRECNAIQLIQSKSNRLQYLKSPSFFGVFRQSNNCPFHPDYVCLDALWPFLKLCTGFLLLSWLGLFAYFRQIESSNCIYLANLRTCDAKNIQITTQRCSKGKIVSNLALIWRFI